MANYEKQVEQEAAYPIPISLNNCYRTVRHEKRGIATPDIAFLMLHCPVTVVQRYRDGVTCVSCICKLKKTHHFRCRRVRVERCQHYYFYCSRNFLFVTIHN